MTPIPFSPALILVSPQLGENIGAAARVMLNFGLTDLRLVNPRDGWPNPKAEDMSAGAHEVLERVEVHSSLASALHDIHVVYATTARNRDMVKTVMTPTLAMEHLHQETQAGKRCALLFGPERTGIINEDIAAAHYLVTIPVNPDFSSINLAQAVGIFCYEYARKHREEEASLRLGKSKPASQEEVLGLLTHLETALTHKDFFKVPSKKPGMVQNIRNIFTRIPLTDQDVRTLRGIIRALSEPSR